LALILIYIVLFMFGFSALYAFSFGYLSHLFLDVLDNADIQPFYPLKINVIGPIPYFSIWELLFALIMLSIYFIA